MKNILLPCGGLSSRFPDSRPKWMLTHPNGNFMIKEAIKGLSISPEDHVYLICMKEHIEKYKCEDGITEQFSEYENFHLVLLDEQTKNQPETIYQCVLKMKIEGQIVIKDCDNFFNVHLPDNQNFIATSDLHDHGMLNPGNKSYVEIGDNGLVSNIVEKKIISDLFCIGCYGFADASDFIRCYDEMSSNDDMYISHIIYKMLLENKNFVSINGTDYLDWGTLDEWREYTSKYATIFIDLDGTLVGNSAQYFEPRWGTTDAIAENVEYINRLYATNRVHIILTTSRKSSCKKETLEQLERIGLDYHDIIFDLFHAQRIIVNDFSKSNPYRSCDAISIKRNDNNLNELLSKIIR